MAAEDRVTWSPGVVTIRDDRAFGRAAARGVEQALSRILGVDGVRSVALDRDRSTVSIRHQTRGGEFARLLERIAASLRAGGDPAAKPAMPRGLWESPRVTIFRHGAILSTCEVLVDRPGRLRLRHPAIGEDRDRADLAGRLLATVPGVRRVAVDRWSGGSFLIAYEPAILPIARLVRLAEEALEDPGGWSRRLDPPTKTHFGFANANMGMAALADFALPVLSPVSAAMLLSANMRTIRLALLQVRRGKFGLPALYVTIVSATLLSGQFFAWAAMAWLFKFWQGQLRLEISTGRKRLLDECVPLPRHARLIAAEGVEILVPIERLGPGDRFAVGFDEPIPADGRVVEGEAIVDERGVGGPAGTTRKRVGDRLLAGSVVRAGSLRGEVVGPPERNLASSIGRALIAATSPAAGPFSPTLQTEAFADRAVGPTLATAGIGLIVGGLPAAGAILRPDYATGPGLVVPLELLRNAATCVWKGIIMRAPDAFDRLAAADLIVLDDSPGLRRSGLAVSGIVASLPEATILRYAASAHRHAADDRSRALADACSARGIYLLDLPAANYEGGISVRVGRRILRVREHRADLGTAGPLAVEIDGTHAGIISFESSSGPASAPAIRRLAEVAARPIVLLSDRSEAETASLARNLGANLHAGGLSVEEKRRILRSCRDRGVRTAFVGGCHGRIGADAHVAVSIGDTGDFESNPAAAVLLETRFELLADLWETALTHSRRVRSAERFVVLPNLLCVAGAFFFGATALTSVVVSGLGTLGVYSRSAGPLRGSRGVAFHPPAGRTRP